MARILQISRPFRCPNRKEPCSNSNPVLQNPAVSLRTFRPPAVSVKSKLADRRFLRLPGIFSQRTPRNTTPTTAKTPGDARVLRLAALGEHGDVDARPGNHLATPTSPATLAPHGHSHCPGLSSVWTAEDVQQHTVSTPQAVLAKTKSDGGVMVVCEW